jgi:hypothetical protein
MQATSVAKIVNHSARRLSYYWSARLLSYGLPIGYYAIKLGITKESTSIVLPLIIVALLGVIRIGMDIPLWVATWPPSFMKGMIRAVPVLLLFIVLVTLGLTFKYMMENQVIVSFVPYFETVFVIFGGASLGSIVYALHLKHKELDMIAKGYVLGTINKSNK